MQAFFRRIKRGETPGYPRFKPASRWNQLEFPHGDRALKLTPSQTKVGIPGVGSVRLRKGRQLRDFGRAFIVEKNGRWYAVFECAGGIDRGIRVLAATSDGELIENRRPGDRIHDRVVFHQRAVDSLTVKDALG